MKLFLVAFVSVLFCAVFVSAASLIDAESMRKSIQCGDDVFGKLAGENKEMEKHHAEYKALAKDANSKLDDCSKVEETDAKEECVESVIMWFSMLKLTELITKVEMENEELATKLMDSIEEQCH